MKKPAAKKSSPWTRVWNSLSLAYQRSSDTLAFNNIRLAAIEDRLARIDGGDDSGAAKQNALYELTSRRVQTGGDLPVFGLTDDGHQLFYKTRLSDDGTRFVEISFKGRAK